MGSYVRHNVQNDVKTSFNVRENDRSFWNLSLRFYVAIAWSVPWNQARYDNTLSVGFPHPTHDPSDMKGFDFQKSMFYKMYKKDYPWFARETYTQKSMNEVKSCNEYVCIHGEYSYGPGQCFKKIIELSRRGGQKF